MPGNFFGGSGGSSAGVSKPEILQLITDSYGSKEKTLTTPAIIKGSADLSTFPGVVTGALPDAAARQANGLALQAALDWCNSNMKFAELPPARYEYEATRVQNSRNVGLQVPKGAMGLIGGGSHPLVGTRLVQYAVNHPVLTISDVGNVNTDACEGALFRGILAGHGVSQTGQAQADAFLLGRTWRSKFDDLFSTPFMSGNNPPSVAFRVGLGLNQFFFSNEIGTITALAAQVSYLHHAAGGTGNRWNNAYFGSGSFGNRVAMSGPPVNFASAGVDHGSFGQLNIEWSATTSALCAVMAVNGDGLTIDHLHLEGMQIPTTVFDCPMIHAVAGRLSIGSMKALDTWIPSGVSGSPKFFSQYGDSRIKVGQFYASWGGSGVHAEAVVAAAFRLFGDHYSPVGFKPHVEIGQIAVQGHSGAFNLDANTAGAAPAAANAIASVEHYRYNKSRSETLGAAINMANANLVVYGQHRRAKITQTVTLTAARNLTLSDKQAASGAGAMSVRQAGDIVEVVRAGAGAFDLLVLDHTGATLFTFSGAASAGTAKSFEWTGTAWTVLA